MKPLRTLELFAGAGGLALGLARQGHVPTMAVDLDADAIATIRKNKHLGCKHLRDCDVVNADVRDIGFAGLAGRVEVVAGGPPCQPFSRGGRSGGHKDDRDMFPEVVRAIREVAPFAFVIENVTGLLRKKFARYFDYVQLQLTYPDLVRRSNEAWTKHLRRLAQHKSASPSDGSPSYHVTWARLNAADFGVPQRRERVMLVGVRSDLRTTFVFPQPTHSSAALSWDKWVSGEYWKRHRIPRRLPPEHLSATLSRLQTVERASLGRAWLTVRDAVTGLPRPYVQEREGLSVTNHVFIPGARSYPGHTGSELDSPSKTLKAGRHGVPGGENMLRLANDSVRYFTIRECARLQCFPDDFVFEGSWSSTVRQLGNAVPVTLAEAIGAQLRELLAATAEPSRSAREAGQATGGSTRSRKALVGLNQ